MNKVSQSPQTTKSSPVAPGAGGQDVQNLRDQIKEELGIDDQQLAQLGEQLGIDLTDPKQLQDLLGAIQMLKQSEGGAPAGAEAAGAEGGSDNPAANRPNPLGPLNDFLNPEVVEKIGEFFKQLQGSGGASSPTATPGATPAAA